MERTERDPKKSNFIDVMIPIFGRKGPYHDLIFLLAKIHLPKWFIKTFEDTCDLIKGIIGYFESQEENFVIAECIRRIRSMRNAIEHSRKIETEVIKNFVESIYQLESFFSTNRDLSICIKSIILIIEDAFKTSGYTILSLTRKYGLEPHKEKDQEEKEEEGYVTMTFSQLKESPYKDRIKGKIITMVDGAYKGQEFRFARTNGNNVRLINVDEAKEKSMVLARKFKIKLSDLN